jgi:hypothetical protein
MGSVSNSASFIVARLSAKLDAIPPARICVAHISVFVK